MPLRHFLDVWILPSAFSVIPARNNSNSGVHFYPQGATFKAEEAQQRICGGEGTGPSTVGADVGTTPCSSESLSRVTSLAHSGITALLRYSLLQQYPSERIGQLLASSEPESPPLSRCTSLLGESLEEPIEAVPVTLRQEPQPQARGPTSSLFATSLPHPPWIRVPPAAGAPAESGHLPPNARWAGQVPTGTTYSEPVFSKELVEVYLKPDEATEFMNQLDLGGIQTSKHIRRPTFKYGFPFSWQVPWGRNSSHALALQAALQWLRACYPGCIANECRSPENSGCKLNARVLLVLSSRVRQDQREDVQARLFYDIQTSWIVH